MTPAMRSTLVLLFALNLLVSCKTVFVHPDATHQKYQEDYYRCRYGVEPPDESNSQERPKLRQQPGWDWCMEALGWRFRRGFAWQSRYARGPAITPQRTAAVPNAESSSTGTCFSVSPSGLVITSAHVINNATSITVEFPDGATYPASVVRKSSMRDIAVSKIGATELSFLGFETQGSAKAGDQVFTVGYPAPSVLGNEPKYSDGAVSALSGPGGDSGFLQMTVPVQPGNSGGPLVNTHGEVIGVVAATAAVIQFFESTGSIPQNVNWAVKAEYARVLVDLPSNPQRVESREAAIALAMNAVCKVSAEGK